MLFKAVIINCEFNKREVVLYYHSVRKLTEVTGVLFHSQILSQWIGALVNN